MQDDKLHSKLMIYDQILAAQIHGFFLHESNVR